MRPRKTPPFCTSSTHTHSLKLAEEGKRSSSSRSQCSQKRAFFPTRTWCTRGDINPTKDIVEVRSDKEGLEASFGNRDRRKCGVGARKGERDREKASSGGVEVARPCHQRISASNHHQLLPKPQPPAAAAQTSSSCASLQVVFGNCCLRASWSSSSHHISSLF